MLSIKFFSLKGGFDGTSNVLAGKLFNIPVKGTHAHAYITSFSGIGELKTRILKHKETGQYISIFYFLIYLILNFLFTGVPGDLLEYSVKHRQSLASVLDVSMEESSEGELAAMVSYAIAFPDGFMALVDTYDVKRYFAFRQILSEQYKLFYFTIFYIIIKNILISQKKD